MFHKPFRVKSNTQLKGSERKRIRQEITKQFPDLSQDDLQTLIPQKEEATSMKIVTHGGDSVFVYCVKKVPVIFELEKVMYPTVYMLWTVPNLLPYFTIWPQVFDRLAGGADLMLPGIVLPGPVHLWAYGSLKKGDRVAVNMTANKAPIAVGQAALSSYDMYMAAQRGKAVKILHCVGDELWSSGTKLKIPELGPPPGHETKVGEDSSISTVLSDQTIDLQSNTESSTLVSEIPSETDTDVSKVISDLSLDSTMTNKENIVPQTDDESPDTSTSVTEICEEDPRESMDKLLKYCFLKAWKTSAKKVDFPLLTSNFYKVHMIPACPSDKQLDLKKSSYKKLSKFLSEMGSLEIIKVRELTKGVESIISVNYNHDMLKDFIDTEEESKATGQMDVLSGIVKPAITELYTVTAAVLPLLSNYGFRKGDHLSVPDVRKYVTEYVKKEKLQDSSNRSMVRINAALQPLVQNQNTAALPWEDLMALMLKRMNQSYQMTFSGDKTVTSKGKLDPIDIQVGRRTGNKKVTLVNNLELYGIDIHEFARECQHGVAASTSISSIPGKKSQQLLVQGNQVIFIGNLLSGKYEIPKRYIRGLEFAPKKK